jgi:hypothetical protein
MKRKLFVFAMLLATTFIWLPGDSNNVSAQNGQERRRENRQDDRRIRQNDDDRRQYGKRRGTWRKKNNYGYRNYGQYRRTQVGNRRYRMVRRYYQSDGIRRSRLVRIFY